ncbi:uncharacterized protein LOC116614806 [Nematostella vectensis]|uniref:uncharacterized protein LOC116614806 n=1 Tax=Nematostella vectensis TaxID=45351 RepID=UPI00138FEF18|nr:uncharacterized protein LOC116614806 [Nematostella vectensis]
MFRWCMDSRLMQIAGIRESMPLDIPSVCFRTSQDTFVTAMPPSCGDGVFSTNASSIGRAEQFEAVQHSQGRVALRTCYGTYIKFTPASKNGAVRMDSETIGPWEIFQIVRLPGQKFALYTDHGTYVSALEPNQQRAPPTDGLRITSHHLFYVETIPETLGVSQVFVLRTFWGTYVTACKPEHDQCGPIFTDSKDEGEREEFWFREEKPGHFLIETCFGELLCAKEPKGLGPVKTDSKKICKEAKFQFVYLTNDKVLVKTVYGTYLSTRDPDIRTGEGSLEAREDRNTCPEMVFEMITLNDLDEERVPSQCCTVC